MELASLIFAVAAFLYGTITTISLAYLAIQLIAKSKLKAAALFSTLSVASTYLLYIFNKQLQHQPPEWPFAPENIPFYLAQIYFCSYAMEVISKDWSPKSKNPRSEFSPLTKTDIAAISFLVCAIVLYIFDWTFFGSLLLVFCAISLELGKRAALPNATEQK